MSLADIQAMKALKIANLNRQDKRTYGSRIVALGDSITIGAVDIPNQSFADNSWYQQFLVRSKGMARYVYNAGIAGQRTDQMLARIQTDVIAKKTDMCVILGGTNDVSQSIPITTTRANIESMITTLLTNNILPVLCKIPPRNGTTYDSGTSLVNLNVVDLARKYKLPLIDFYSVVTTNIGDYISSPVYTTDGTHPTAIATKQMAIKALNTLSPYINGFVDHLPSDNLDPNNLAPNGCFVTDSNADGLPDSWGLYGSGTNVTSSLISDSNTIGNWLRLTAGTGNSGSKFVQLNNVNVGTAFSVGDKLAIVGKVRVTAEAGSMSYSLFVPCNDASVTIKPMSGWSTDIDGQVYTEFIVPSGTTSINIQAYINSGVGTLDIAQMGLINLTKLGLSQY